MLIITDDYRGRQNFGKERSHQIIDEMANALTMHKELIQQLRDEIAGLKGLKQKPKIPLVS